MQTPFGIECNFFYGNYFRGRDHEECRLIGHTTTGPKWTSDYCKKCPVPEILQANACPNMVLEASIKQSFFGLSKRVEVVSAYCTKSKQFVKEPKIGCGKCHPLPPIYLEEER